MKKRDLWEVVEEYVKQHDGILPPWSKVSAEMDSLLDSIGSHEIVSVEETDDGRFIIKRRERLQWGRIERSEEK
jgi:hypothetical protein